MQKSITCDVAIIGGGPAGSTAGTLLKKYNPGLKVCIFEREIFPRDHIGESLLPPISKILHEMGCWDAIEAANFPIKIGATYRWGKTPQLWDFDFVPVAEYEEAPRPAQYEGQRVSTAFQVDRSIYDTILLTHAENSGCQVFQGSKVAEVVVEGDEVQGLRLENGETVTARHYVDASGNSGVLRRAMDIECAYHPSLKNIAIWDYWQNADWAVKIGVGGTRIQVRTIPYGWIWFIPMGPTRTSIGLVTPVEYFKQSGKRPEELYLQAVSDEATVKSLLSTATREELLKTTKDWSFTAAKNYGKNWYLIGECAGFADPILSAGVTMAHTAGRELAYTINEIEAGSDAAWLKEQFGSRQFQRIQTHIRFGDYWYTANEQLKDLKEFTTTLAEACGLNLEPERAWDWISRGGFIDEDSFIGNGIFDLRSLKASKNFLTDLSFKSPFEKFNVFELDLEGTREQFRANYVDGKVKRVKCLVRENRVLPLTGVFELLVKMLQHEKSLSRLRGWLDHLLQEHASNKDFVEGVAPKFSVALEAMVNDGWVKAHYDPQEPLSRPSAEFAGFHLNTDTA